MQKLHLGRFNREVALRVIADTFLVNFAVLFAIALRFFYEVAFNSELVTDGSRSLLWHYFNAYLNSTWLLTPICLAIFGLMGLYTHSRSYRSRYKALILIQATTLSYLLFGFMSYFVGGALLLPRGVIALAWLSSMALVVGTRLWSLVFDKGPANQANPIQVGQHPQSMVYSVLVIGGAGYIGSALLPKMLAKGYRVRLLDLLMYGPEPIKEVLNHPNLEIIQADFRQVDKVVEAMQGMDAVIHLGAIVGDPACALDEELTTEVNLMATRMIAEVAKGCGIQRFIFASTCSVYGASDEILDERSALNPVSLYARSKIGSERILHQMADARFAPVILRFGTIYGLSGRTRFDLVVNLLTAMAVVDHRITVFGGDQWRPFVHVDDAALAVFKVLEAPLPVVRNQTFNVGSKEQNYTLDQIGELIQGLVPTAELISKGSDGDRRNYRVNFSKISNTLNFQPQWTMEQGMLQVIEAIKTGQVTNYQDATYSNVKFLKEQNGVLILRGLNQWAGLLINDNYTTYSLPEVAPSKEKIAS